MEEETEIIETQPVQTPGVMQMPAVSPLLLPLFLPFILIQQFSLAMMQMTMQPMTAPQQTVVKLGYDKDGNITSIYERRW